GAEDGNQMNERRRPVGADELDAAVETQIAENRWEDAKIEQAESAEIIEHDRLPVRDLQRHAWQQRYRAATHADGKKGKGMDHRPQPQCCDVRCIDQESNYKPEIALVECNCEQDRKAALTDDHDHAGKR